MQNLPASSQQLARRKALLQVDPSPVVWDMNSQIEICLIQEFFKMDKVLRQKFYSRHPTKVARDLIGKSLVRRLDDGTRLEGIIVETEAYGGSLDPASHAFRGVTERNRAMFDASGRAYIYFIYGFHNCLNFVTGKKGVASAVLIRALEPVKGLAVMSKLRKTEIPSHLASGPGKICQAFSIDRALNGIDVTSVSSPIHVIDNNLKLNVKSSVRVGIRNGIDKKWRFYAKSNENVSRMSGIKHKTNRDSS